MTKFLILFSSLLLVCHSSLGQEKWDVNSVFDKVEESHGNGKNYSYALDYKLYESGVSTKIADEYKGQVIKKDKVSYQKINRVESVNFGDYNVSVDNGEKTLTIAKIANKNSPIALKYLLKICNKKKLTDAKGYWICELLPNDGFEKQFTKINIYINKKDFSLNKQIFFTEGSQEIEKNKKVILLKNPRLEILYVKDNKMLVNNAELVTKGYYFNIRNKKIIPAARFKKYKLITL